MKIPFRSLVFSLSLLCAASQSGAVGRMTEVNVFDRDSGEQLQPYFYRGQYYVVGTPGNRYAVSVRNTTGERLMAVVSVDGVNVVSGETAAPAQSGYVLDRYSSTEINGWRKNMNEVAAFVFSKEASSYAARTGRPDNVGVIGVAVFREKPRPKYYNERDAKPGDPARPSAAPDAATSSERGAQADHAPAPRLGTAHGQRESSEVNYTDFIRASSRPDEVISIRYDSYRNLVAQGVIRGRNNRPGNPNPFPGQFVPDPR
jgi:hypothetical protein